MGYNNCVKKLLLFVTLAFIVNSQIKSHAQQQESDFDTVYNIEYALNSSLEMEITENIGIINQTSFAVPISFTETITNMSIYDIKAYDSKNKEIVTQVEEKDKSLIIKIPIENPAVGKNKKTQITLTYKTRDLAHKTGRILNVSIPKAPVSNRIQEYNVTLKVPKDFGPQISLSPKPFEEKMEEEGYILIYNKQSLEQYGISATFGDYQVFDFELKGQLKNDSIFSKTQSVVLPPQLNNYQEISLLKIEPKPVKLIKDSNENILAVYKIPSKGQINYIIKGKAKIYNKKINLSQTPDYSQIPKELNIYLKSSLYWETDEKAIKELAKSHDSPEKIYKYITKNLTYDYELLKLNKKPIRKGGLKALTDKKGLCLDFTDAFITLARSAGIPAREVSGYAYTKDPFKNPASQDNSAGVFMHSWVQYYHPSYGWVSVDPTWGATSGLDYFSRLDNNHFALVIRGSYLEDFEVPQDIKVDFSDDEFYSHESLYDLNKIPTETLPNLGLYAILGIVLMLGLCTIFVAAIVRSRGR